MSKGMTRAGLEVLARAYYGLDLVGDSTHSKKTARKVSIKCSIRGGLITTDHRITEQGLWVLRRNAKKYK